MLARGFRKTIWYGHGGKAALCGGKLAGSLSFQCPTAGSQSPPKGDIRPKSLYPRRYNALPILEGGRPQPAGMTRHKSAVLTYACPQITYHVSSSAVASLKWLSPRVALDCDMATLKHDHDLQDSDGAPASPARIGSWRYLGSKRAEVEDGEQGDDDEDEISSERSTRLRYAPPWADVSIIGIAGSSGSGKSTLSKAIVQKLSLPWVVILSMVGSRMRS
jgi:hypothetical protein